MRHIAVFLLFVASSAWAADGDECSTAQFRGNPGSYGCRLMIDNQTGASGGPNTFDLTPILAQHPTSICFSVGQTFCSVGTVTITHALSPASSIVHNFFSTALQLDIDESAPTGRTERCVNLTDRDDPIGASARISWSGATCVGSGFDIMVHGNKKP